MRNGLRMMAGLLAAALLPAAARALPSEITVDLRLDETHYVCGERLRGVVEVRNMGTDTLSVGRPDSPDRLFIEVFRRADATELDRTAGRPFVAPFRLAANEGLKLETFLADHYDFAIQGNYFARPVLVHAGMRYVGQNRPFNVEPGFRLTSAVQMFANRPGLSRLFELQTLNRRGTPHLFLSARDEGGKGNRWMTTDIGAMMKQTPPTISILAGGQVVVVHRNGPGSFVRSEFWSLPDALDFRTRQMIRDPETAGQQGVQEMYRRSGKVEAKGNPWWKFW